MRTRKHILEDLLYLTGDIAKLQHELSQYPWDIETPIIVITRADIYHVLSKFKNDDINFALIENWANAIEGREDLEFENENLKEIINELANPALFNKQLTKRRLTEIIDELDGTVSD